MSLVVNKDDFVNDCLEHFNNDCLNYMSVDEASRESLEDLEIDHEDFIDYVMGDGYIFKEQLRTESVEWFIKPFRRLFEIYDNLIL